MDIFDIKPSVVGKKLVIWGTGVVSIELVGRIQTEIAFFIDNDKQKWGKFLEGKEIKDPDVINGSKEYYVIIAIRGCLDEIEEQIAGYGLEHYRDYEYSFDTTTACYHHFLRNTQEFL